MSDSKYKENFRKEMIDWSDGIRSKDPGYFCKAASDQGFIYFVEKQIWKHYGCILNFSPFKIDMDHK